MDSKPEYKNTDQYIALFAPSTQEVLQKIRQTIQKAAPTATEGISYQIPTFFTTRVLIHFAGYKHHIGLYPGALAIEVFADRLTNYKTSKGTVQFRLNQDIPYDLITEIVKFKLQQNEQKDKAKTK